MLIDFYLIKHASLNSLSERGLRFAGSEGHPIKMKVANVCRSAEGFSNRDRIFSPGKGAGKIHKVHIIYMESQPEEERKREHA